MAQIKTTHESAKKEEGKEGSCRVFFDLFPDKVGGISDIFTLRVRRGRRKL